MGSNVVESEKLIEAKLVAEVKNKLGGIAFKFLSTVTGLPDRICLLPGGRVFFVELKTTGKHPTPMQKVVHRKLQKLGFRVEVVSSSLEIDRLIKEYEYNN